MHYQFLCGVHSDRLQNSDTFTITKSGQVRFFRQEESLLIRNRETDDHSPRHETSLVDFQVHDAVALASFISLVSGKPLCYMGEIGDTYRFRIDGPEAECFTPVHFQFRYINQHVLLSREDCFSIDPDTSEISFTRNQRRMDIFDRHGGQKDSVRRLRRHPLEKPQIEAIAGLFSLLSDIPVHQTRRSQGESHYIFGDAPRS